jgi:formylglycine-generating enzyme required for sulfatase activity
MQLVRIEPGEFLMGQGEGPPQTEEEWYQRDYDESPAHKVRITQAFLMGTTEVTNAQYEQFDSDHNKLRGKFDNTEADNEPVTSITWQHAVDFCEWLSEKEGKRYRLPTESEWEYACRAGTTTLYNTGDTLTSEQANFGISADNRNIDAVKVGSYNPNAWSLFDMHGNVAEWCLDWYGPYEAGEQSDPVGRVDGYARVVRGWSTCPVSHPKGVLRFVRSANRSGHLPEDANRYTGFRVVQAELPTTKPLPIASLPLNQQNVRQSPANKDGPDPDQPYYVIFTEEKKLATMPKDAWGPIFAAWNHYSTVTVCPNGDVLAVWYSTVHEEGRECSQAASRLRVGTDQWEPASSFFTVPDCNSHAPVLLSEGKRLYHFFTQSLAGWDAAADCLRTSEDSGATWSKPQIILARDHPQSMSQPCSAFVAKDGTLVLAVDGDFGHRDERVLISRDRGETWQVGQGDLRKAAGKYAIHPAVLQMSDGNILSFLRGPNPMPAFISKDLGESWEPTPTPFPGISVGQKAAALKLQSGAILLVSFNNRWSEKDGEVSLHGGSAFAALSLDDGKTWPHVRKIDNVGGYMSLAQAANGVIYHFGWRMEAAAYNEAWLKDGEPLRLGN